MTRHLQMNISYKNQVKILIFLTLTILMGCTTDTTSPEIEYFHTFVKLGEITTAELAGKYPQDAKLYGDTLYILTRDSLNNSTLELFRHSTMEHLTSFKSWTTPNEAKDSLVSGMTLTISDSLICVGSEGSRVDIFDRSTLTYKSTVGNGNWWGDENTLLVHSFSLAIANNQLIIRDKYNLRIYSVADLTEENYKKVPIIARSIELGGNHSKDRFGMVVVDNNLFVTNHQNSSIDIFNLADFTEGNMDITPIDTIHLSSKPYDIDLYKDELYIATNSAEIVVIDKDTQKQVSELHFIEGHNFNNPQTIQFTNDAFFIVEASDSKLITCEVQYHEFSIYR